MRTVFLLVVCLVMPGCYLPPTTAGADLSSIGLVGGPATAEAAAEQRDRRPAAAAPVAIAAIRIQAAGALCIPEELRTAEEERALQRLGRLPGVGSVVPLDAVKLPRPVRSELELRKAAAAAGADVALVYTFDSATESANAIPLIGVVTLGIFPICVGRGTCTASAVLIDVDSGYVYNTLEATKGEYRITNGWSLHTALHRVHRGSERWAFDKLIGQLEESWSGVAARFGPAAE